MASSHGNPTLKSSEESAGFAGFMPQPRVSVSEKHSTSDPRSIGNAPPPNQPCYYRHVTADTFSPPFSYSQRLSIRLHTAVASVVLTMLPPAWRGQLWDKSRAHVL